MILNYDNFINESYNINVDEKGIPLNFNDIRYVKKVTFKTYTGKLIILKKPLYITRDGIVKNEDGTLKSIKTNYTTNLGHPYILVQLG